MEDFSIGEMQQMQKALQEKYRHNGSRFASDVYKRQARRWGKISFFG